MTVIIDDVYYDWSQDSMLEVILAQPDDFLKVKETLERIGIASVSTKTLWQSCMILHKQGRYFIVHFKELFLLDGKTSNLTMNDVARRNAIAYLLQEWKLVKLVKPELYEKRLPVSSMKIIPHRERTDWNLKSKYDIGVIKK